jgi:hypothetical protein
VTVRDTRGREIDGACGQLVATVTGRSVGPARRRSGIAASGIAASGIDAPAGATALPLA